MKRRRAQRALWVLGVLAASPAAMAQPPPGPPASPGVATAAPVEIAVVDGHVTAADPAVGAFVTSVLRRVAEKVGYVVVPQDRTRAGLAALRTPGPLGAGALREVARHVGVSRSAVVNVTGAGGRYFVQVHVASAAAGGPWYAQGEATALDLPGAVEDLAVKALPAPGADSVAPRTEAEPLRLALFTESAFGISGDGFYNHLLGGRLDYRFTPEVFAGGALAYANLKGKEGRVGNVLPLGVLGYRLGLGESDDVAIPLRFATGYLPKNGPVLRFSAGLGFRLGGTTELSFDLAAPMFWVTRNQVVTSFDLQAELSFAL